VKSDYKSAGVNIAEADRFVDQIRPIVKKTFTNAVVSGIGNFGAFYKPDFMKYKDPILVSSVDGVGTKLKIAAEMGIYDTIGEDLVNHCVNDITVCGAVPMFFLDYYAVGMLNASVGKKIVAGLARGCANNSCSLIGGETAEMPGIYSGNDFDLAGSITGIVEKKKIVNSANVRAGDVLIGLRSNGLHTNGYSLVRKIFGTGENLKKKYSGIKTILGKELLRVHRSYLDIVQESLKNYSISSISHITGGGIIGNTVRVVPKAFAIRVDWNSWKRDAIFDLIMKEGNVPEDDMRRTFNLGIGLIFIVRKKVADEFTKFLITKKEKPVLMGEIHKV
jgi:phosphoribosylformylglycinamidine cyclo-ligase